MNRDEIHPDSGPSPEQFAAFLDGELAAAVRTRVEAWLSQHPADAEEIDGQRKLMRLWQASVPPEPSSTAWAAAFDRVEANCGHLRVGRASLRRIALAKRQPGRRRACRGSVDAALPSRRPS